MKKETRQQRLEKAKKALEKTLRDTGYRLAQQRYGKSRRPDFPNLKVEKSSIPSLGDGFARTPGKKQLPADAKQFPVGQSHKQGPMLITGADNLADMGGKKT